MKIKNVDVQLVDVGEGIEVPAAREELCRILMVPNIRRARIGCRKETRPPIGAAPNQNHPEVIPSNEKYITSEE